MRKEGFSLIEVMIVLAVIAVLAAIALPRYEDFVAKSQLTAALAEIEPGRPMIEVAFADAADPSIVDASFVGLPKSSVRCAQISVSLTLDGTSTLSCRVIGSKAVNGRTISLRRAASGGWSCDASAFHARHKPGECG
ncbi:MULTISPECIES: pilin [unclassified Xanthomonas]|uniref:pilin n=1 Tax=Xanthomonas sp. LMG 9002 TaxID=1591158 RepID=UPI001369794C|nr:pilin [Xanthomonas sp. LMG 9002]MXV07505.1 prepilin-type N-terminal cleavage/methylation domain-containing protein [Xanthomonas sp. LMG 9002]